MVREIEDIGNHMLKLELQFQLCILSVKQLGVLWEDQVLVECFYLDQEDFQHQDSVALHAEEEQQHLDMVELQAFSLDTSQFKDLQKKFTI